MNDDELWLDGNAYAGLLGELFELELTTAERSCQSCGERRAVGAHRAYRGAGIVLRCPACGDLAMRIAVLPGRHVVQLAGTWTFDVPERANTQERSARGA
jgi:hypothetical protein